MKATIILEIEDFKTPNFVRCKPKSVKGIVEDDKRTIHLSDLDPTTLDRLCDNFRREIFKKASKPQPDQAAPVCSRCGESV